jgi:enolase
MKITNVSALEVLDSRGNPTVRAFVTLDDGSRHVATVPSGASTGKYEALELRDADKTRYLGLGVSQAVNNIKSMIAPVLVGMDISDPKSLDAEMLKIDGTENKSKLGANAILAVSEAVVRAAAHNAGVPLWKFINEYYGFKGEAKFPRLMVNVVNGGKHANWNFDIQEFILITESTVPSTSLRVASEIFHAIGKKIKGMKMSTLVGDEGGYSPMLNSNEEAFELIIDSARDLGYENTKEYHLAMDAAASEFYENGQYVMKKDNKTISGEELLKYYLELRAKYTVFSYEDIFDQDDAENFAKITATAIAEGFQIVGDDFTVTNPSIIKKYIDQKAANAVIIKPNQIGSMSETIEAIQLAQSAGWKIAVSHRSGESEDSFIADLAYGVGADFIKTGSMSRSDRLAKYNRLLEIEAGFN